jgi:long-chain fatty acid transport protein
MRKKLLGLSIVLCLLASSGMLCASGISLFEIGSRAASMSGAYVGLADNSSAIYYNPAGIAFQKGVGFRLNVTYSKYKVTAESKEEQNAGLYDSIDERLQGSFFISWNAFDRVSIGLGGFSPHAIGTHWPINWPGEQLNSIAKVSTFYLRPVIAIKVTDGLAVGAGLDIVWASQRWESEMYYRYNIAHSNGTGIGFSGGILFKPSERFQFGGRYQHRVKVDHEGTYKAQSSPSGSAATNLGGTFRTQYKSAAIAGSSVSTSILHPYNPMDVLEFYDIISTQTLPSEAVFGVMWSPMNKFRVLADAQWTEWSTFDNVKFTSKDPGYDSVLSIGLNWKDTWSYKFGVEYFIKDILSLRGGFAHHQSPSPDETLSPILPVLPHDILSFGIGYNGPVRSIADQSLLGKLTFDVFIQYVMSKTTTSTLKDFPFNYYGYTFYQDFPFAYSSDNFVLGFGVGFNF